MSSAMAGFNPAEFFGSLRSLVTQFAGLAMVTTSRFSVAVMNRQGEELAPYGSPFFKGFIGVSLRAFDDDVSALLEKGLPEQVWPLTRRIVNFCVPWAVSIPSRSRWLRERCAMR